MTEEVSQKLNDLTITDDKKIIDDKTTTTTLTKSTSNTNSATDSTTNNNAQSKEPVSIFSSKHFTAYHPLNSKWTLWYTKPPTNRNESWNDLLKPVITFSTVEEFWGIYNAIPSANELPIKSDYHLFKEGIRPEWEDVVNSKGGKWAYQFKEKSKVDINDLWMRSVLALIGETIEENEENEVNGVVLNVRKVFYRIGLWTKSCDKKSLEPIGKKFKTILKIRDDDQVEFTSHDDGDTTASKKSFHV
ncbi:translation initiation factor eIF4E [Ascoidea rubescens DSM 1968]|uniref:Eukaryotic translation initiation factor 4E n=1 Tax=Ascoidea rubescens DSM 1968 TaxID=1344418 RepID=A0A1D2VGK5_9ASCO|nr:eukaryotic translation initiation factor 4E [Ascoidea rubescens DSM 1968]ODV60766.1 eukaryotic translation initiation factor 4E [Ascoidea rubescens DSM 1968]